MIPKEETAVHLEAQLRAAVAASDWAGAGHACDSLRFGHGWTYARMVELFGAERWEEIAQAIDEAEASE